MTKNILVTGGLGFIGSHLCVELINSHYNPIIVDNLSNSKISVLDRIIKITEKDSIKFYELDITNKYALNDVFMENNIDYVIHAAGFKSVNQSIKYPLDYYNNNVCCTLVLLDVMKKHSCKNLLFSSSATVYGQQNYPVNECSTVGQGISNPYGKTKYMIEQILTDLYNSDNSWNIVILRYFNPAGAHPSGLIGEDPNDIPNNLFPYILKVAKRNSTEKLLIFGNDYNTPDGTCLRDYIHVCDLVKGHIAALNKTGLCIYNLGSGKPVSVLEFVEEFIKVNNIDIKYEFVGRRDGDLPTVYANIDKAYNWLGWKTEKTLSDICIDGWKFANNKVV